LLFSPPAPPPPLPPFFSFLILFMVSELDVTMRKVLQAAPEKPSSNIADAFAPITVTKDSLPLARVLEGSQKASTSQLITVATDLITFSYR